MPRKLSLALVLRVNTTKQRVDRAARDWVAGVCQWDPEKKEWLRVRERNGCTALHSTIPLCLSSMSADFHANVRWIVALII